MPIWQPVSGRGFRGSVHRHTAPSQVAKPKTQDRLLSGPLGRWVSLLSLRPLAWHGCLGLKPMSGNCLGQAYDGVTVPTTCPRSALQTGTSKMEPLEEVTSRRSGLDTAHSTRCGNSPNGSPSPCVQVTAGPLKVRAAALYFPLTARTPSPEGPKGPQTQPQAANVYKAELAGTVATGHAWMAFQLVH